MYPNAALSNLKSTAPSMNFMAGAGDEPKGIVVPRYTYDVYLRFAFAGALCCSVTHTGVVPIDVVKTRLQTNPEKYKGMLDAFRKIPAQEGPMMLLQGAGATAVGYFLQGAFKFGFNEFFKGQFMTAAGPENAQKYRVPIWLGAGACAEFIADLFLCPLEATRIRSVAQPDFGKGLVDVFGKILRQEGVLAFYKGFTPLLFKQVPYTMAKFSVFEATSETIYKSLPYKKEQMSTASQLTVSLSSGVVAGVAAAIISQPADTLLSKVNQEKSADGFFKVIGRIYKKIGAKGLFMGTGARCVMVGTITAGQFFIYDYCKIMMGVSPQQLKEKQAAADAAKKH
jgi:solute carrier family 25 phosphate transporter 3